MKRVLVLLIGELLKHLDDFFHLILIVYWQVFHALLSHPPSFPVSLIHFSRVLAPQTVSPVLHTPRRLQTPFWCKAVCARQATSISPALQIPLAWNARSVPAGPRQQKAPPLPALASALSLRSCDWTRPIRVYAPW